MNLMLDMRYAARQLIKASAYIIVASTAFAFGKGCKTSVFSVLVAVNQ